MKKISKHIQIKYDLAIYWIKSQKGEINSADKVSLFPFLNWYDEAKLFTDYCKSVGEDDIALDVIKGWQKNH